MTQEQAARVPRPRHCERGHITVGLTIAGVVIIIFFILVPTITGIKSVSGLLDLFMSQPWWVQFLIVGAPVSVLLAGAAFDRSSEWPKSL